MCQALFGTLCVTPIAMLIFKKTAENRVKNFFQLYAFFLRWIVAVLARKPCYSFGYRPRQVFSQTKIGRLVEPRPGATDPFLWL